MEYYFHISMQDPSATIYLPQLLGFSGETQIGVVECSLPRSINNLTSDDVIRHAYYKPYSRRYIQLFEGNYIDQKLSDLLKQFNYEESEVRYVNDHFEVSMGKRYVLKIVTQLANMLGIEKERIQGTVVGRRIQRTAQTYWSGYLYFYNSRPQKYIYRPIGGHYETAKEMQRAFGNVKFTKTGDVQIPKNSIDELYMSPSLRHKLRSGSQISSYFLKCHNIESEHFGDYSLPILRIIPKHTPNIQFYPVHYKTLWINSSSPILHMAFAGDDGERVTFSSPLNFTIHIRNASSKKALL